MSVIPLDRLPFPDAVADEDFTALRSRALLRLRELIPDYEPLPTDPAVRLLEVAAYIRLLLGGRVNDAVRATFLATATGADLDQVAATMNTARLDGESDEALRTRAQLAWTALSVAGPRDAYRFHALSVPGVRDVGVGSPAPGTVRVVVLSNADGGVTDAALLAAVQAALDDETIRPVTDVVQVQAAAVRAVDVTATLKVAADGPALGVVQETARAALDAYLSAYAIGRNVYRSMVIAALHAPGVETVALAEPAADVTVAATEVAVGGTITLTTERLG